MQIQEYTTAIVSVGLNIDTSQEHFRVSLFDNVVNQLTIDHVFVD
jgi:hypothetical protein